jgi:hypothetical protein
MRRHLAYLRYVLRHKWFVMRGCWIMGASLWLGLIHDLSKFRPSEWMPYARCFYKPDGSKQYDESEEFNEAWNWHQKRNKHHWQAWIVIMDRGEAFPLPMPEVYIREMICDWIGAGLAITGKMETREWYTKSKDKMLLHPRTRARVEQLMEELP